MKSIERRFKNLEAKNTYSSSYSLFARTITGQNFSKHTIHYWFSRLVDKDDYSQDDKKSILKYLESLSKVPEDAIKIAQIDSLT